MNEAIVCGQYGIVSPSFLSLYHGLAARRACYVELNIRAGQTLMAIHIHRPFINHYYVSRLDLRVEDRWVSPVCGLARPSRCLRKERPLGLTVAMWSVKARKLLRSCAEHGQPSVQASGLN
jgi:hypothetical protein